MDLNFLMTGYKHCSETGSLSSQHARALQRDCSHCTAKCMQLTSYAVNKPLMSVLLINASADRLAGVQEIGSYLRP